MGFARPGHFSRQEDLYLRLNKLTEYYRTQEFQLNRQMKPAHLMEAVLRATESQTMCSLAVKSTRFSANKGWQTSAR